MTTLAILAIPAAFLAWAVCKEEVFREIREAAEKWTSWAGKKLAYLCTCYFCTAVWTGLLFLALHPIRLVSDGPQGYLVAWWVLVAIEEVYLSGFHVLRLLVRWAGAKADYEELITKNTQFMHDR